MDEYKRKVDSIRAPEALIAATLNRIHEEEKQEIPTPAQQPAVVPFKPRRKWFGTAAIAAAAALALVIGLNMNTPGMELTYGTIPDTIVRSNFPTTDTRQMDLTEYSALMDLDVESLIPGESIIKSDIQVDMDNDFVISDECTLTYNAQGNPLMLRLSGTQDVLPEALTQVEPSDVEGLSIYAAVSESGKSRMAGFRQDGFSFFLMGSNMDHEQFETLLGDLIQNIQK
jgi:hypothetical protein